MAGKHLTSIRLQRSAGRSKHEVQIKGMASQNEIDNAIRNRDSIALRKMAQRAPRLETRIFLNLLADFVERDLKKLEKAAA
jgi:hypothetical protein